MNIVVSHNLIVPKYMINVNRKGSKNPKARAWVGGARKTKILSLLARRARKSRAQKNSPRTRAKLGSG